MRCVQGAMPKGATCRVSGPTEWRTNSVVQPSLLRLSGELWIVLRPDPAVILMEGLAGSLQGGKFRQAGRRCLKWGQSCSMLITPVLRKTHWRGKVSFKVGLRFFEFLPSVFMCLVMCVCLCLLCFCGRLMELTTVTFSQNIFQNNFSFGVLPNGIEWCNYFPRHRSG